MFLGFALLEMKLQCILLCKHYFIIVQLFFQGKFLELEVC